MESPETPEANTGAQTAGLATDKVGQHMTRTVTTVDASTSLAEVARILATRRISGAVVIARGKAIGVISERDIVRAVATDSVRWAQHRVGAAMSQPAELIDTDTTMVEAVETFIEHRVRRLPVVTEEGELVGVLTQTDFLRAMHQALRKQVADHEAVTPTAQDVSPSLHAADSAGPESG
jgi:CBS domain-containing protein